MTVLAAVINNTVKPALVEKLGIALATLVILQNSKQCDILVANIDNDGYTKLIDAIIADKRVSSIFSKDLLIAKKAEWLQQIK